MVTKNYFSTHLWSGVIAMVAIMLLSLIPASVYAAVSAPTDVKVTTLTPTSATLGWEWTTTETLDRHDIDIRVSTIALTSSVYPTATTETEGVVLSQTVENLEEPSFLIAPLAEGTYYYVYMRENATHDNQGTSSWVTLTFATPCSATSVLPISGNFDASASQLPTCWSSLGTAPTFSSSIHHGDAGNSVKLDGSVASSYLYSPILSSSSNAYYLTAYIYGAAGAKYRVGIASTEDWLNAEILLEGTIKTANTWTFIDAVVPAELRAAIEGGMEYLWVIYSAEGDNSSFYVDDVEIGLLPACITPSALTIGEVTENSVQLSWTERGTATAWVVEYSDGTETYQVAANSNPFILGSLTSNTAYTVRVQANCGSESSNWTEVENFKTLCGVTDIPFSEGFEDVSAIPDCWSQTQTVAGSGSGTDYADNCWKLNTSSYNAHSGSKSLQLQDTKDGTHTILVSPHFATEVEGGLTLSFWMYRTTGTTKADEGVKVWVNNQPNLNGATALMHVTRCGGVAADALKVAPITTAGWYQYEKVLPIAGDVYVIFEGISEYGSSSYLDDIEVSATPTCLKPTDLHLASFDAESATLAWTAGGSESAWELTYKLGTNDAVTVPVNGTPEYIIEGLTPATSYTLSNLSLCAVCSTTDSSAVASFSNISFKTPCVTRMLSVESIEEGFENTSFAPACWSTSRLAGTEGGWSRSSSRHHDGSASAQLADAHSGNRNILASPQFHLDAPNAARVSFWMQRTNSYNDKTEEGVRVWVNTVNNDTLGGTALMHVTRSYSQGGTGIKVPAETQEGWYNYTAIIPVAGDVYILFEGISEYGASSYIDDVVIETLPTCEKPSAATAIAASANSLKVDITDNDANHTAWQVIIGESGFDKEAATPIALTAKSSTVEIPFAMEAGTTYEAYVRVVCGAEDGNSSWMSAGSFAYIDWSKLGEDIIFSTSTTYPWTLEQVDDVWQASSGNYHVASSVSTLTATFDVPDNAKSTLSFDYQVGSESASYDYLVLFIDDACDNPDYNSGGNFNTDFGKKGGTLTSGSYSLSFNTPGTHRVMWMYRKDSGTDRDIDKAIVSNVILATFSCVEPTTFNMGAITESSAVLNWGATTADSYQVLLYDSIPETIGEGYLRDLAANTNSITFDELESNTGYYVYIRSICGGEPSDWSVVTSFRTECEAVTIPYAEGFEDEDAINCWKVVGDAIVASSDDAFTGSKSLSVTTVSSAANLVLPKFDIETVGTYNFNLAVKANAAADLHFGVYTGNMEEFIPFSTNLTISSSNVNKWVEYSFSLAEWATDEEMVSARYLAFQIPSGVTVLLDTIEVVLPASCPKPTALTIQPNGEDVVIDWTSDADNHEAKIFLAADNSEVFFGTIDKPFTPNGLSANTEYTIQVRAKCGEDNSEWSTMVAFKTPCPLAQVPFEENFGNITAPAATYESDQADNAVFPDCWDYLNDGSHLVSVADITDYSYLDGISGNYVQFAGSKVSYVFLPAIDGSEGRLALSLDYTLESSGSSGSLVVGYVTIPGDTATFVALSDLEKVEKTLTQAEVIFPQMDIVYPAVKFIPSSASYITIFGNVKVDLVPNCIKPSKIAVSAVASSTAKLSWTANGDESQWQLIYKLSSKSKADTVIVNGAAEYTIENLTAGTSYTLSGIKLRAICSETDSSEVASFSNIYFSTECGLIETPWFENFDNSPSGKCWSLPSGVTMTTSSSYANSGTGILRFATKDTCVVVLPDFGALNGKRFTFTYRAEGTGTNNTMGFIKVGYVTNPLDTSTFVALADYNEHVFEHTPGMVIFGSAVPAGAQPAIQYYGATGSNWYLFMDDFVIEEVPTCEAPTALNLVAATDASLQIAIVDDADATAWEYALNNVEGAIHALDNSTFMIEELDAQTEYTVYVRRVCGENASSRWISANFKTACGSQAIPWSENFDDEPSSDCWILPSGVTMTTSSSYANSGTGILKFATTDTCVVVLPDFGDLNGKRMTFTYRAEGDGSNTTMGYIKAGYITNPLDAETFVALADYNKHVFTHTPTKVNFGTDVPEGARAAILYYGATNANWFFFIDDFVVEDTPACEALAAVTLSNATRHSFDINLTPAFGETPTGFELVISEQELDAAALESASKISLDTAAYPVNGLLLNTMYHVYARVNCGAENGVSAWVNDSIKTLSCAKLNSLNAVNVSRREMDIVIVSGTPHEDKNYELIISDVQLTEEEREAYNGIINVVDTNVYHASGLTRETTYYIYARQSCGEDGVGEWISQVATTKGLTACDEPVVGAGASSTQYVPVYGSWTDSEQRSQTIYPASMLTELIGQTITKLHYFVTSGSSGNGYGWDDALFEVRMGITTLDNLSSSYASEALTTVYHGYLTASVANGMDVVLSTPFVYTGGNLVIEFEELQPGSYYTSCYFKADYVSGASRYEYSTYSPTSYAYRPQVAFSYCYSNEACPAINIANVSHEYVGNGTSAVVLNWGASDGDYANSYDILVSETEVVDFTEVVPTKDSISALTATIDGLEPFTDYYVYFRTNCDAEGQQEGSSAWSEAYTFKTKSACDIVSNVQVEVTGKTSAVLSWSSDDDNFVYFLADAILTSAEQEAAVKTSVTDTTAVELVDLVEGQTYYAYVAHDCGDEGISPFIVSEPFTMPESCPQVINLESYYLAHNAVGLKWNRGYFGDETAWEIGIVNDENSVRTISDSTCMFIGLQPDSLYTFYVKALCSDEESSLTATIELRTSQTPGDEASVGDGTSKNYGPICGFYGYERNGYIFTSEDGLNAGVIQSIAWQYYTADKSIPTQIYLKNTTESEFTSTADLVWNQMIADATLVYDATVTTVNGWLEIDITDFQYTGGNLMILVASNVGSSGGASAEAYYTAGGSNNHCYARKDNSMDDDGTFSSMSSSGINNLRHNIRFTFEPKAGCRKVVDLKTVNLDTYTASITWFPGGDETSWLVYNSPVPMSDAQLNALELEPVTDMVIEIDTLQASTNYYFYISGICSDSINQWAVLSYQTLATCLPVNGLSAVAEAYAANISWLPNKPSFSGTYVIAYGLAKEFDLANPQTYTSVTSDTESVRIEGLSSGTSYSFAVKAICEADDESIWSESSNFTTECRLMALPYVQNFDDMMVPNAAYSSSVAPVFPNCWDYSYDGSNMISVANTASTTFISANSGDNAIVFSGSTVAYVFLPAVSGENGRVRLHFAYRQESVTNSGTFLVGYLTVAGDESTFVKMDSLAKTTSYIETEVIFPQLEYVYPAIKFIPTSSTNYYAAIDDIRMTKLAYAEPYTDITCSTQDYEGYGFTLAQEDMHIGLNRLERIEESDNETAVDTVRVLELTVVESSITELNDTACAGSGYYKGEFNINNVRPNIRYELDLVNAIGCDSIVYLTLYVPETNYTAAATICEGDTYEFGTQLLTTSGEYQETFTSVECGCDSIVTLTLTVLPAQVTLNETICEGDSIFFDGAYRKESDAYVAELTNILGCDSTVTLNLTVLEKTNEARQGVFCSGSVYNDNDFVDLDSAGVYTLVLTNAANCDSIITLTLVEHEPEAVSISATIVQGEAYVFGNNTYTEEGVYVETFVDQYGCDSVVTLTLTVSTDLEEVLSNEAIKAAEKFMHNGILYIRANDIIYDAQGKRVIVRKED